jgi:hypothetical protein
MTIAANANLLDEVTATLELRFRGFGLRLWLGTRKSGSAKDGENHSEHNTEQLPCRLRSQVSLVVSPSHVDSPFLGGIRMCSDASVWPKLDWLSAILAAW